MIGPALGLLPVLGFEALFEMALSQSSRHEAFRVAEVQVINAIPKNGVGYFGHCFQVGLCLTFVCRLKIVTL